jgi:diacylglycerol O-acyltransferase / wax synthase
MRQLTSLDAQFLVAEDGAQYGHVTGLAIYDASERPAGGLTRESVSKIVSNRIHLVPPFRQRLVKVPFGLDLPYWVEDADFNPDAHVREHTLPAPGDDRALAEYVGRVMGEQLDLSRPPWGIDVIQGLSGGRVAVATRIHHAASDGLAMAALFAILHDPTGGGRDPSAAVSCTERVPSRAEMLVRGLAGIPKQPARFARSFPRAMPHLDQVVTLRGIPGVPEAAAVVRRLQRSLRRSGDGDMLPGPSALSPRTLTSARISGRRAAAFTSTSLAEIKQIKNRFGVTVNDVVMAIIAGALREWLRDHNDLPGDPLAAMVPVSVRAPDQPGAFGNKIAMMIPALFTDEPDAAVRLERTHEAMRAAKERHRAVPATLLQDANHFIPPVLLARAARASAIVGTMPGRRRTAANLLISNIPGAREPMYMGGARLVAHYPLSAIFHGMGLNITVVSYVDQVDWGIAIDPEQIDDAWGLSERIRGAQAELLELTAVQASPAA